MTGPQKPDLSNLAWFSTEPAELPDNAGRWRADAACRGIPAADISRLFFIAPGQPIPRETRELCGACPVAAECLAFAVANNEQGIWAATTARQRRQQRQQRRSNMRAVRAAGPDCSDPSPAGYQRHRYRGEGACVGCREAWRQAWHTNRRPEAV